MDEALVRRPHEKPERKAANASLSAYLVWHGDLNKLLVLHALRRTNQATPDHWKQGRLAMAL